MKLQNGSFPIIILNEAAPTILYTLSLHDALPILNSREPLEPRRQINRVTDDRGIHPLVRTNIDRKSTRLNSSHVSISYAVFCLIKKRVQAMFLKMKEK